MSNGKTVTKQRRKEEENIQGGTLMFMSQLWYLMKTAGLNRYQFILELSPCCGHTLAKLIKKPGS